MKKRYFATFFCFLMPLVAVFSAYVFFCSMLSDWHDGELELFELVFRIIGYAVYLIVDFLLTIFILKYRKNYYHQKSARASVIIVFLTTVLLCVYDIATYATHGNELEGTFTMLDFLLLDGALLLLYTIVIILGASNRRGAFFRVSLAVIILLWAVYLFGEMAGYPTSQLTDWDEAVMKITPLCHAVIMMLFTNDGVKAAENIGKRD